MPPIDKLPAAGEMAGIWAVAQGELVPLERYDVGPAVVLVPTESVLLLAVDLPLPSPRRRLEALPFAIEDRIAAPLADVHVALGAELSPGRYLAGIVSRDCMATWMDLLDHAGLHGAALVPDVLGLPVPPEVAWSVEAERGRIIVRTDDETGFALPQAHFTGVWETCGRPRLLSYGDPLDPAFAAEPAADDGSDLAGRLTRPALDLRQGAYAAPRRGASPLWRRIALVAVAGAAAHAAIAGADTLALGHIAQARKAEARALLAQAAPGTLLGDDLATDVATLLPANGAGPSAFLPLFGRVAGALKPLGAQVRMRDLSYDGAAGTMSVAIEAPTLAAIQQVGPALGQAGLSIQPGTSSAADGRAVGSFLIRSGA